MRRFVVAATIVAFLSGLTAPSSQALAHVLVGGTDNVSTAIAWSQLRFSEGNVYGESSRTAIIARDDSFADALAAGALAGELVAPFLVTPTNDLDDRVVAELDRVRVEHVIIIGGTAAVSAAVEAELDGLGYRVDRLAGENRVATAVKVATDARDADGNLTFPLSGGRAVTIARAFGEGSTGFADSLGGGVFAGQQGGPMLVTTSPLSPEAEAYAADFIAEYDRRQAELGTSYQAPFTLVGGTAAVSDAVLHRLHDMGANAVRVAGPNRFATAAAIAAETFFGGPGQTVALVDSHHPDSWVSGFAFPAFPGGGLVLSFGTELPQETRDALARMAGLTEGMTTLYCAPQVPASACEAADAILNG